MSSATDYYTSAIRQINRSEKVKKNKIAKTK